MKTTVTTLHLALFAAIALMCEALLAAAERPMGVCEAFNSAVDHQVVTIEARIAFTTHLTYLFEGTGRDPCPGWRKRIFAAPSVIPIAIGAREIRMPKVLIYEWLELFGIWRMRDRAGPSLKLIGTVRGVIIKKQFPLSFRLSDGEYFGWGEGLDGAYAAVIVPTSLPIVTR